MNALRHHPLHELLADIVADEPDRPGFQSVEMCIRDRSATDATYTLIFGSVPDGRIITLAPSARVNDSTFDFGR